MLNSQPNKRKGKNMKFSELKNIKSFCEQLDSSPNWKEVVNNITSFNTDFEVDNVRFISDDVILEVLTEEIFEGDDYVLGYFNPNFIAQNSDLNYELIKTCQESGAYEAVGKALYSTLTQDEKMSFCEEYASVDGYGHHFNGMILVRKR